MKKLLRYANFMALAAGAVGAGIMLCLLAAGTDERGLYPANHPAWILSGIWTAAVVVGCWLLSRQVGINRNFRQNFPASLVGAAGCGIGALGLLATGFSYLRTEVGAMHTVTGIVGILAAVCLLFRGLQRLRGQKGKLPLHILPCAFFALNLFFLGQKFGSEPELCRYLYSFWATVTMVPACYHLWGFDVNLGKRPACIFWCLVAGYCNLVALANDYCWQLHLCTAVWMLCALPRLGYLPKPHRPTPVTQAAEEHPLPVEDTAAPAEEASSPVETPPDISAEPAQNPLRVDLPDPESVLEELLRDFSQQENP